jgi:hypothetical protein
MATGLNAIIGKTLSLTTSSRTAFASGVAFSSPSPQMPTSRARYNPHSASPARGFAQSGFNEVTHPAGGRSLRRGPHRSLQIPKSARF